jgi:hypothetical protein
MPSRPPVLETTLKSTFLEVGRTSFMFALRQNARGRFLRITEKNQDAFGSIVVPETGLVAFAQMLATMCLAAQPAEAGFTPRTEEVRIERKVFSFVLDQDTTRRYLRIVEHAGSRANELIVLTKGLADFKQRVDEMVQAADAQPMVAGAETGAPPPAEFGEYLLKNGQLLAGNRTFTFQIKQNEQGRYLRIIQDKEGRLTTIIVPGEFIEEFKKWVLEMAKAAKKKPAKKKAKPSAKSRRTKAQATADEPPLPEAETA